MKIVEKGPSSTSIEEKIPMKSKFSYGILYFAHVVLSGLGLGPITYYYNVHLGLSEFYTGLAWLIFIAWNALNDPLFGFIEDRTKSEKYGRRIPYIRFGAPFYVILFIICWFPLVGLNDQVALFWYFLFILFAFDTIFTIVGLITYSMPAEMAITSKARAGVMIFVSIFTGLGTLLTFLLPSVLLTGSDAPPIAVFQNTMVILGIICGVIIFIASYYIKENKYTYLEEPLSYWNSIKETFKNKPFLIFEVGAFCLTVAQYTLTGAVFYYLDFVLDIGGVLTIVPLVIFFGMIFAFTIVFNKFLGKYELKTIFFWTIIFTGAAFFLFFFIGWNFFTAIIAMVLLGIGYSGQTMTIQMVLADAIDYDEMRTGKRRETSYSGVSALITKPAVSIAPWLFLTIISSYGFINVPGTEQSYSAKLGIMIGIALIPGIFSLLAAIAIKFFPLGGAEWKEQKNKLQAIHIEKEKNYLDYLKEKQS